MIINNELVNQLVRNDESVATFSLKPALRDLTDEHGRHRQRGARIPILDALRGLVAAAGRLHPTRIHPADLTGVSVSAAAWEAIVISAERGIPCQEDLLEPTPTRIAAEVKAATAAYGFAEKAIQAMSGDPDFSMEKFVSVICKSPNLALTKDLLTDAGPANSGWTSVDGKLAPLQTEFPTALSASHPVEVKARIFDVNDRTGVAEVEITEYRNEHSAAVLCHHAARVELRFERPGVERDDLLVAQYWQTPIWLRVSATCATHARHKRLTSLTLSQILVSRNELDRWHATARQIPIQFDEVPS